MSDLSRLFGDVYGTGDERPADPEAVDEHASTAEAPVEGAPSGEPGQATTLSGALPAWADDTVLDEAFANWVPGPPDDAPGAERGMLSDLASRPAEATSPPTDPRSTPVADAVPGNPNFIFPSGDEAGGGLPVPAPSRWQRGDDDLLPLRARSRRWRRS